jgi:hypothetical protein
LEKSKILLAIPPLAMILPANMKKGMAIRMYESMASNIITGGTFQSIPVAIAPIADPNPKQTAIGTPKIKNATAT